MLCNTDLNPEAVHLTLEDRQRIYQPWLSSIILKLYGKSLAQLIDLWKPTEPFSLIDLGKVYFVTKLTQHENMQKVLHEGPWFVTRSFLSVEKWEPNFVPEEAQLTHTAIWVRLPQLSTEFYD